MTTNKFLIFPLDSVNLGGSNKYVSYILVGAPSFSFRPIFCFGNNHRMKRGKGKQQVAAAQVAPVEVQLVLPLDDKDLAGPTDFCNWALEGRLLMGCALSLG